MPSQCRHVRAISAISILVTVIGAASWGAMALTRPGSHAAAYAVGIAVATTPTAAGLWAVRWLDGRGIAYLLDMMVSQRARTRRRPDAPTLPLRVVR